MLELCPAMKDRENEEEIQMNFCFVLADELERDGIISYHGKRLLDLDDSVLPLFSSPNSTACLMLHLMGQNHGLELEEVPEEVGDGGGNAKIEETRNVLGEQECKEPEEEIEIAASERRRWRQQDTVIIYDHDNYSNDYQFEGELPECSISETPSKSTSHHH